MKTPTTSGARGVLGNLEFRALLFAEVQSVAGDQLTTVALAITVYARTGSALWAAGAYALTYLPALAGGLGLAQLADRFPRRSVLSISSAIQAVIVGVMAIPGMPLGALLPMLVLARLVGSPANAAQNSMTRDVFPEDEPYLRSQDIRGVGTNTAMLLGLGGGGLLVELTGVSWALAADALTFAVSALVVRRWVRHRPAPGGSAGAWFGALHWVTGKADLRVLLGLSWLVGLAMVPEGLVVPLADQIGAPQESVGWLLAADPLGFIVGVYLFSRYLSVSTRSRTLGALAVAPAAILILFATRPGLVAILITLALAGAAGAYIVTVGAVFTTSVPNELRAGAGGVYRTGLRVAQGLGVALGGVIAELVGSAAAAIAFAGVAGVVLGIPLALAWARVRGDAGLSV